MQRSRKAEFIGLAATALAQITGAPAGAQTVAQTSAPTQLNDSERLERAMLFEAAEQQPAAFTPAQAQDFTQKMRTLLQMPRIWMTAADQDMRGRQLEAQGWTGTRWGGTMNGSAQCVQTAALGGTAQQVCVVNPTAADDTFGKVLKISIGFIETQPLEFAYFESLQPTALDTRTYQQLFAFHEYFHAVDHTNLKPRHQESYLLPLPKALDETRVVKAVFPEFGGEMLADIAAAELLYRITPANERPHLVEQVKDWQAFRQLSYVGVYANDGTPTLHEHYTAPGLQRWLAEAAQRDPPSIPVWSSPRLTPAQIMDVGRYAESMRDDVLAHTTIQDLRQEGQLAIALNRVASDRAEEARLHRAPEPTVKAAHLQALATVVNDTRTTPTMLEDTATALRRLTQASANKHPEWAAAIPFGQLQKLPTQPLKPSVKPAVRVAFALSR